MRPAYVAVLAVALAAPALAQGSPDEPKPEATPAAVVETQATPPQPGTVTDAKLMVEPVPAVRQVEIGVAGRDSNTASSKFREYRALPEAAVLPQLRFAGEENALRYDFLARNVLQRDAFYWARASKGVFELEGSFTKIPHLFGNEARSALEDVGGGSFVGHTSLQQQFQTAIEQQRAVSPASINFAFLNGLAGSLLAGTRPIDIGLERQQGRLDLRLTRDQPVDVRLTYFFEKRDGNRGAGTAFGFGNVVETAEPIDYRTHDLGLTAEWVKPKGLLRGALHFNLFDNKIPFQTFANPFRATDSTDASAYQSPGSASIAGASVGRISLPPDNSSITGSLGFAVKLAGHSRLSADASYGEWRQNEKFMPFSTNTAIIVPFDATDPAHLPARSLDGRIDVFTLASAFTSRPVDGLTFTARYRRYDLNNKTPRLRFPEGYARFDAVWEEIPRESVPYGYVNDNAQASVGYDFSVGSTGLTLETGYKFDRMERSFRETGHTLQHTVFGSAQVRGADWMVLRGTVEWGRRDFRDLEIERSEDASFLEPGAPANLLAVPLDSTLSPCATVGVACNLRYDQAKKDTTRVLGQLQLSPGGKATAVFTYALGRDNFKETIFGLTRAKNESFGAEVDYTPVERLNLFAYYSRENISSFLRGRQSGSTVSVNPLDDWTSDLTDKVDSIGGGLTVAVVKDKADLKVVGNYQKANGNADIAAPVGGAPEVAKRALGGVLGIPNLDDTKLLSLSSELAYKLNKAWTVTVGGLFEDYVADDAFSTGLGNYVPAAFFLAGSDGNYRAGWFYARLAYTW
jgi:MtrB/PioB family decaheme-associated outer membrane protein